MISRDSARWGSKLLQAGVRRLARDEGLESIWSRHAADLLGEKILRSSMVIMSAACVFGGLLWSVSSPANPPPVSADQASPPGSFFSSLKQAFKQDLNYEVVRGHFDVGSAPDAHRFYCLVDIRTGKNEEYGVGGETFVRPDGMTGLKASGVSPDSCAKVEEQGRLVTTGYIVKLGPKATPTPAITPAATPTAAVPASPAVAAVSAATPEVTKTSSAIEKLDVAGIRLGMSADQVRAVLKVRGLSNYLEATQSLGRNDGSAAPATRFVNVIAAWTPGSEIGESYEVMFTPVPGRERVLAVVHSVVSSKAAVSAGALQAGLITKYGGYRSGTDLPEAPTWRLQSDGDVQTGDACGRRTLFGGLTDFDPNHVRDNLALKTPPDEFRNQIEQCGVAIVTEDQVGAAQGRNVVRYTVSAYSPVLGLDGQMAAAPLIQTFAGKSSSQGKDSSTPNL
jgi:hypothetical protein